MGSSCSGDGGRFDESELGLRAADLAPPHVVRRRLSQCQHEQQQQQEQERHQRMKQSSDLSNVDLVTVERDLTTATSELSSEGAAQSCLEDLSSISDLPDTSPVAPFPPTHHRTCRRRSPQCSSFAGGTGRHSDETMRTSVVGCAPLGASRISVPANNNAACLDEEHRRALRPLPADSAQWPVANPAGFADFY
jgi:hypothetical protein